MIGYARAHRSRYAAVGALFLVLMVGFVALTVGIYRKVFTPEELVTLRVERIGTQLAPGADVKVRGVLVGSVRSVSADAGGASITLALNPKDTELVPANVSARVLPKTLFGERYVDLRLPDDPGPAIAAGAVIPQDRSQTAIEGQQVLDHLLPTLQAVRPAELATTLSALDQALHGRGAQLGTTLVGLDNYLKGVNPAVPNLVRVFADLRPVTDIYAQAAPDLFEGLADLTTTSRTFADKREQLRRVFLGGRSTSDTLTDYLDDHSDELVALAGKTRPTLEVLARYAPEFPCFIHQVSEARPLIEKFFGKGTAHPEQVRVTAELSTTNGKYAPGVDTPKNGDNRGPRCYDQTPVATQYPPGGPLNDGSRKPNPPSNEPDPLAGLLPLGVDTPREEGEATTGSELLMVPMIGDRPGVPTEQPHPATPLEGTR